MGPRGRRERQLSVSAACDHCCVSRKQQFAVFVTLTFLDFKEMGFGLAVAVLIDATIIRGVLLPASMKLLGDWNWYLPRWLEWLPRVGAERDAAPPLPAPDEPEAEEPRHAPLPV
jgi:putative drug exporter of the RND superfamily